MLRNYPGNKLMDMKEEEKIVALTQLWLVRGATDWLRFTLQPLGTWRGHVISRNGSGPVVGRPSDWRIGGVGAAADGPSGICRKTCLISNCWYAAVSLVGQIDKHQGATDGPRAVVCPCLSQLKTKTMRSSCNDLKLNTNDSSFHTSVMEDCNNPAK